MKRNLFNCAWAVILAVCLCACSGDDSDDPVSSGNDDNTESGTESGTEGGSSSSSEITAPYTISVDKTTIEANGEDAATFTLTDANGYDITADSKQSNYITIENVETGETLSSHSTAFTSLTNGTYEFKANYKAYESENTVTVTVQNRGQYEKYYRKVVAYDVTSVSCTYCPDMTAALEGTVSPWQDHMVIFAIHGPYTSSEPWMLKVNSDYVGTEVMSKFGGSGYPFCVFNLNYVMTTSDRNSTSVGRIVNSQLTNYPATCGIKIASTYSNGAITLSGSLTSVDGGTYDLGYAILADNQDYYGTEYNDIVLQISSNYMSMRSSSSFTVGAGEEHTVDFTVSDIDASEYDGGLDNLRVAVFALRNADGTIIIDNIADCPLGENLDYNLND